MIYAAFWGELKKIAKVFKDRLRGGDADGGKPGDFDPRQMAMGVKEEREHTRDPHLRKEIAMDHLSQNPKYYSAMERVKHILEPNKSRS